MAQSASMIDVTSQDWPEVGQPRHPDDALIVKFYNRPAQNEFLSEQEGRPVYQDKVYIEIMTAGNQLSTIDRPAYQLDFNRFPRHYARFQAGQHGEGQQPGTPLSHWPALTPAMVENLRAQKFYTVDQVAGASDLQIQAIGMHAGMAPASFREKARAFIASAKNSAAYEKQMAELAALKKDQAEKDAAAAEREAKRDAEIAELRAMLEKSTAPTPITERTLTVKKSA